MLKTISTLLFIVFSATSFAMPTDFLDQLKSLPNTIGSLTLQDGLTGKVLYEYQSNLPLKPASNIKLFTSYVALKTLGPDYVFKTNIRFSKKQLNDGILNGDLEIEFLGDPTYTSERYLDLIQAIKTQGIHTIEGHVVLNSTSFPPPYHAQGWTVDDLPWYYAPPIGALSLDKNHVQTTIMPGAKLGEKAQVILAQKLPYAVDLQSDVKTVTVEESKFCSIEVKQRDNQYQISGCWPIEGSNPSLKFSNQALEFFVKKIILNTAKANSLEIKKGIVFSATKHPVQTSVTSLPLSQILPDILGKSDNFYTESVLKAIGFEKYGVGSYAMGIKALKETLFDMGLDIKQLLLEDGSGVSQYNLATSKQLAQLLFLAYHEPFGALFMQSLAKPNQLGSLKNRFQGLDPTYTFVGKTGTLRGSSALSGILSDNQSKQLLIISIILNNSTQSNAELNAFIDKVVLSLR